MDSEVKALNPQYSGMRVRDVQDLFPKAFSAHELAGAYRDLTWSLEDERLILESAPFEDVDSYYNPGHEAVTDDFILEAITVDRFSRTEKRMAAVVRVLNKHLDGGEIQALDPIVGRPKKSGTFAYVTVQLPFSDGQSVSVVFHSPEGDKKKIGPDDQIIAFRWLLNKRDITHTVAPEDGAEVSLDTIAVRITQLVVKNSARFSTQQKDAFEEVQGLKSAREALDAATEQKMALADRVLATQKEYDTIAAKAANTKRAIEKQQQINADLEGKIAEAKAKAVTKPVAATNGESSGEPLNPTSPAGYAKVLADEALQLEYQDQLDAFFQERAVLVLSALRKRGWEGKVEGALSKGGHELVMNFKHVGAGKNVVGMSYEIKGVPGFFMGETLVNDHVLMAERIDLGLTNAIGKDSQPLGGKADPINGTSVYNLNRGDVLKDTYDNLYSYWDQRHDVMEVFPIVEGKPEINADSGVKVNLTDGARDRNKDYRSDPFYLVRDAGEKQPDPTPAENPDVPILPSKEQDKNPAKRVSKLLYAHGFQEKVMQPGFHAVLKKDPFEDLSIETHASENGMVDIFFTQYVEMGGDMVIDSEIVFRTSPKSGYLKQFQTAGRGIAGEFRGNDTIFGNVITKNLIDQGFLTATVSDKVSVGEKTVEPEVQTSPNAAAANFPTLFTTFDVPFADKGNGWIVMNAARPIVGDETAQGEFLKGRSYAAIDLSSEFAAQNIETNRKLDAAIVLKVTRTQFQAIAVKQIPEKYWDKWKEMTYVDQLQAIEPYYDKIKDLPYSEAKALLAEIGDGTALAPKDDTDPHRGEDGDNVTRPDPDNQPTTGGVPDLAVMVKEAARWRGAAMKKAHTLSGDKKMALKLSNMTGKHDLDAYLMRKFGIDESTAHDVSNTLTAQNIPDDMTAEIQDYANEPWAQLEAAVTGPTFTDQELSIFKSAVQVASGDDPLALRVSDVYRAFEEVKNAGASTYNFKDWLLSWNLSERVAKEVNDVAEEMNQPEKTPEPQPEPTPVEPATPAEPAAVGILKAIVAGEYDNDAKALDAALDGAAAELEAAGLMEQYDVLLNQCADKAAALAIEAAKGVK